MERQELAIEFVFCLVLIEVLSKVTVATYLRHFHIFQRGGGRERGNAQSDCWMHIGSIVMCGPLIQLSVHPVPESFIHTIEDFAFKNFKQQETPKERYTD